jgi:plastocyanin
LNFSFFYQFSMLFPSFALALLPWVFAAVHDVQVGANGKLQYTPEAIAAQPGDQVVFHFNPKNHTVTQSSFANPCGLKAGGFASGFMPVPANQTGNLPTYTITINDTQPVWVYCSQAANTPASHCGQGMVFAVNCGLDGSPNSFTNFKKAALSIGASLSAAASSATPWPTAAYGGYTIPPAPEVTPVTQTVSVNDTVWTTTYNSYPGSPAPTPATLAGQIHRVIVGGAGGLVFDPPNIAALPRDVVVFEFHQKNHTVTQSSFADPCRELNANGTIGFDSDFMPVSVNATNFPTWNLTVNDTAPIWAYCRQKNPSSHCGAGMVFAINSVETSDRNFTAFQNVAKALNGTATATNNPSATSVPHSGAPSMHHGCLTLIVLSAALMAAFA